MRTQRTTTRAALTVLALATAVTTSAARNPETEIRGEVVAVRQSESTQNAGALDELTVRTSQGETQRLLLGQAGECIDCVRVGDRIRARVMAGEPAGAAQRVQAMRVERSGEKYTFRNAGGTRGGESARAGTPPQSAPRAQGNSAGARCGRHGR